jgi:hypothetical protein
VPQLHVYEDLAAGVAAQGIRTSMACGPVFCVLPPQLCTGFQSVLPMDSILS